ncbi:MAG TPA: hypothetical protein VG245_10295 [Candidatus Dormibacteraeota bacterium]|jgi:hypothetical protein|nr:hypothetical protein [Candidatus Dormibacteraeota bacterium]
MEHENDRLRRGRLHHLDVLLDALESLNLREAKEIPADLRHSLVQAGIQVPGRPDFSSLIERVWELQEKYLNAAGTPEAGPAAGSRGYPA